MVKVGGLHYSLGPMLLAILLAASVMASAVAAYDGLDFEVRNESVDIWILKDGSIDIDYAIELANYGTLTGVDIGLPNRYYDLGSATASITIGSKQ